MAFAALFATFLVQDFLQAQSKNKVLPKFSQREISDLPKIPHLWPRICEALGTSSTGKIASIVGVSAASVSEWKHGKTLPSVYHLMHIANLGNTSVDWLLGLAGGSVIKAPSIVERYYGLGDYQQVALMLKSEVVNELRKLAKSSGSGIKLVADKITVDGILLEKIIESLLTDALAKLAAAPNLNIAIAETSFTDKEKKAIQQMADAGGISFEETVAHLLREALAMKGIGQVPDFIPVPVFNMMSEELEEKVFRHLDSLPDEPTRQAETKKLIGALVTRAATP